MKLVHGLVGGCMTLHRHIPSREQTHNATEQYALVEAMAVQCVRPSDQVTDK